MKLACDNQVGCLRKPLSHGLWARPGGNSRQETSYAFEEGKPMFRTLRKTLTVTLAMLCMTSALALAADGSLSGTVQNVDPQLGRITVRAGEHNVVKLGAPADL